MAAEVPLEQRLRALFAEELADGLQVLVPGLLSLEGADQASRSGLVRDLFRAAHSLKGAAHAAAVPEALAACDRLESAFAAVRDGDQTPDAALVTGLLAETDGLRTLVERLRPTAEPPAAAAFRPAPSGEVIPQARTVTAVSAPAPTQRTASLRVAADQLDAVLHHAGEGMVASRRLHEVAEQAARVAEKVDGARNEARSALQQKGAHAVSRRPRALLDEAVGAVASLARSLEAADRALHHASSGTADAVQRLRTQPFREACSSLDRVVRDIATSTGKRARLTVQGGDIDVDRGVIAALRDPLLHLVRNAVDHGLETAQVRQVAGKPATGTVAVVATLAGSLLHVTIRDDGTGIDTERLRQEATRRGIPQPAEDAELAFLPGLSSRVDVTAVSGRGIGLDAVRAGLEQLGGTVQVVSRTGAGTEVRLTTPVSLAVMRVLLVRGGAQTVALPTSSVERVAQVPRQALREADGRVLLTLGRRTVRAVLLGDALGFGPRPAGRGADEQLGVIVLPDSDVVLVTEALLDELEVAVHPVPARLAGAPGVLGVTVTSGGLPTVVVNPAALARHTSPILLEAPAPGGPAAVRILLAEDTVTTRALERGILEAAGYSVAVAVDGADAWQQLQADGADLVVTDVDMPRMSGIDLCRRIRSSAQLRELPVVLVTSLDSAEDRQRGLEAGADAYVVKAELQQGSLLDTVARLL